MVVVVCFYHCGNELKSSLVVSTGNILILNAIWMYETNIVIWFAHFKWNGIIYGAFEYRRFRKCFSVILMNDNIIIWIVFATFSGQHFGFKTFSIYMRRKKNNSNNNLHVCGIFASTFLLSLMWNLQLPFSQFRCLFMKQ